MTKEELDEMREHVRDCNAIRDDVKAIKVALIGDLSGKGGVANSVTLLTQAVFDPKTGLLVRVEKLEKKFDRWFWTCAGATAVINLLVTWGPKLINAFGK